MKNNLNNILKVIQKGFNKIFSKVVINNKDFILENNNCSQTYLYDDNLTDKLFDFLGDNKMFKSIVEKLILTHKQYSVKYKGELILIINKSIKIFGNECDLNWIDTSKITGMSYLFYEMSTFNGHIENWDVSNVENMNRMFLNAKAFNQPIGDWNVSKVKDMHGMFASALSFNQPIGNWNVSNVEDMTSMFCLAESFNQPIGDWDVSNVKDMYSMFSYAKAFNQPIGDWNISNVKDISWMFNNACSFNQLLNNWDIRNIKNMNYMFTNCPIKEKYKPILNN